MRSMPDQSTTLSHHPIQWRDQSKLDSCHFHVGPANQLSSPLHLSAQDGNQPKGSFWIHPWHGITGLKEERGCFEAEMDRLESKSTSWFPPTKKERTGPDVSPCCTTVIFSQPPFCGWRGRTRGHGHQRGHCTTVGLHTMAKSPPTRSVFFLFWCKPDDEMSSTGHCVWICTIKWASKRKGPWWVLMESTDKDRLSQGISTGQTPCGEEWQSMILAKEWMSSPAVQGGSCFFL